MRMLDCAEAQARVLACAWRLPAEPVALAEALGRVLADDVHADADVPPFAKSAVDGFACRTADLGQPLDIAGEVAAGAAPGMPLAPGTCLRIMTGAPLPAGADGVVMKEQAPVGADGRVRVDAGVQPAHVCAQGEDARAGDRVLERDLRLRPAHLAVLATTGCTRPLVSARPRVAVIATGSELAPPGQTPRPGQIRNSNETQLIALLAALGLPAEARGIAPDRPEALEAALAAALETCDVVLSTGGVSVGEYDLVPEAAQALGLEVHVRRVAIQPGKPIVVATGRRRALFGLSGNPVSSYLQFQLFVQPFLFALMGAADPARTVAATLGEPLVRRASDRTRFVPVRFAADGCAAPVPFHGSAHVHGLAHAHGWAALPPGVARIEAGAPIGVRLLE